MHKALKKSKVMSTCVSMIIIMALVVTGMNFQYSNVYGANNVVLEIHGCQISTTVEGFRTIYSVYDPDNVVVEAGLVYGMKDSTQESDMFLGSTNPTVFSYAATNDGVAKKQHSNYADAKSYVMTMRFVKDARFFQDEIRVRVYAKLGDGSYVYSDCKSLSVFYLADALYQRGMMKTAAGHDYLYNNILSVVDSNYKKVDYQWVGGIVGPGDVETTKPDTEKPTEEPTEAPTEKPTEEPTEEPTEAPTEEPTEEETSGIEIVVPDSNKATGVPGKPNLSHDQWDTDGDYNISCNMWYGNNATCYVLYEKKGANGTYKAIKTGIMTDDTPNAQSVVVPITGKKIPGTYYYYMDFKNKWGTTSSEEISLSVGSSDSSSIVLETIDDDEIALQYVMSQGTKSFEIDFTDAVAPEFSVVSSNTSAVEASILGNKLVLNAKASGRSGIKLVEKNTGEERYFGVRVKNLDGTLSALPDYVALGQVSEDSDGDLEFWKATSNDDTNKRVDIRYIYINGGPISGWQSWNPDDPGKRVRNYIQESLKLGMIPYFVYYNIPDAAEDYSVDLAHINDVEYMEAYYKDLVYFLEICDMYDAGDTVGIILEPDFLGYMMQQAGANPTAIKAAGVEGAYSSGVLKKGVDPTFPNTVTGIVESINYIISTKYPSAVFGWQFNTWGYTNAPGNGLMHATETMGYVNGLSFIKNAAQVTANYYMDAGILSYGADFISVDKYGLDGAYEAGASANPESSKWFWNADLWSNYLYYTKTLHETTNMPVTLWQIPVGHINHSMESNPYTGGSFADLTNAVQNYEDSAPTYFFGDTFDAMTTSRFNYFSKNVWNDPKVTVSGNTITYGSHMEEAADAGVTCVLFGAGVGASTDAVGAPPLDNYWWITKAQRYYDNPVGIK